MSVNEQHTDEEAKQEMDDATNEEQEVVNEADESAAEGAGSDSRLSELEKLAEENQQRYLRAQADFDNFRRRTTKEKEELAQYASMKLVTQLLPVVDNFVRAVEAAKAGGDVESFAKGVDMIFRQFEGVLDAEGLKPMDVVGQPFNPDFHQAIMTVESDEFEEGIVVEEIQKGYMLKDKVLRPAMVKVSG